MGRPSATRVVALALAALLVMLGAPAAGLTEGLAAPLDAGTGATSPALGTSRRDGGAPWVRAEPIAGHLLVSIERPLPITARPGAGATVGTMPDGSRFYGQPIVAWVLEVSGDGRYGLVPVPYAGADVVGWIRLRDLDERVGHVEVRADLSEHRIEVLRGDRVLFRARAATGARVSPTPPGRYFVTDRVALARGSAFGSFAFGLSGIQTDLPPGWTGGDQLAIHGTDDPGSIGASASAGCLRVSERALRRLRPLLRRGTPVVIVP